MAAFKQRLTQHYGLVMSPSPEEIDAWEAKADAFTQRGMSLQEASDLAAKEAFPSYGMGPKEELVLPLAVSRIWQPRNG